MVKDSVVSIWFQKSDFCRSCNRLCIKHRESALENFNRELLKIKQLNFSKTPSVGVHAVLCTLCHRFRISRAARFCEIFWKNWISEKLSIALKNTWIAKKYNLTWNFDTTYDVKRRSIERSWIYFLENLWRDVSACV